NLNFEGATFNFIGNDAVNSTETTTGSLTVNAGLTTITVTAKAGFQADFTTGPVTLGAGGSALIRGSGLGAAAGAGIATVKATGAGYVSVGQGGAAGTFNKG